MSSLNLKKNISLKNFSTIRIGGKADYFLSAKDKIQLIKGIKFAQEKKLPFFILGGGSNILFSDKRYKGLIIKIENKNYKIKNKTITVGAGMLLSELLRVAIKENFKGLEWVIGIPGTVGGAIYGNTGAFGWEMKDIVSKVKVLDIKKLKEKILKNKDCKFSYRSSCFKTKKK